MSNTLVLPAIIARQVLPALLLVQATVHRVGTLLVVPLPPIALLTARQCVIIILALVIGQVVLATTLVFNFIKNLKLEHR